MPPSSSMMRGHRVISRILSPFLRWLDRRIDARIAAREAVIVSDLAPRVAATRADFTRALGLTASPSSTSTEVAV